MRQLPTATGVAAYLRLLEDMPRCLCMHLAGFLGSKGGRKRLSHIVAFGLFCLNAYICRELFTAGFLGNLSSNEGAFVS